MKLKTLAATQTSPGPGPEVLSALAPLMAIVLIGFLIIGIALPVLPIYVHSELKLSAFFVGLVTGSQFAASLISRVWAGHYADRSGPKRAVVVGMLVASVSGLIYLLSFALKSAPLVSVLTLVVGRGLLGAAESFIITGALSWGLARVHGASGRVIAWVGMSMFAAFALGAPVGTLLYAKYGFVAIALATALMPALTLLPVLSMPPLTPRSETKPSIKRVIKTVATPGFGLALSSIGFGSITAFIALLFLQQGWTPAWLAFTAFATSFIAARVVFGHLPDRLGGAKVALVFALIEGLGQALIWCATTSEVALVGAALTGAGYSLVYPALGLVAVRRVPVENRGLAMGAYTAFLDVALGVATPCLGMLANWTGLQALFLIGALAACGSAGVAFILIDNA